MTSIVSVWLGADLKKQWDSHCRIKKTSASASLRQLIRFLLAKENHSLNVTTTDIGEDSVKRIEIRLRTSQYSKLIRESQQQGFCHTRYIVALVDAHLSTIKTPQLGQYELDTLTYSNSQLLMLGRNLNQIARQLNTSLESSDQLKLALIEEIRKEINSHTQLVAALIESNLKRWQGGKHE